MYRHVTFSRGVLTASLASGPILFGAIALSNTVGSSDPVAVDLSGSPFLLALAVPVVVFGTLLGVLPNLIGTALLANVACGNVAMRLPIAWGLIGGLAAGGAARAADADPETLFVFAATGAICALICRWGTRWLD